MAFVSGTFGPHSWPIPVTAVPYPDCEDRFKWFAYFLILGHVDQRLAQFTSDLLSHPRILFKPWIRLQPALLSIVQELRLKRIVTLKDLRREWKLKPDCESTRTHASFPLIKLLVFRSRIAFATLVT